MSIFDIRDQVEAIKACADDDEAAHGMEDGLRADALRAIADRDIYGAHAAEAACLALSTADIAFSRRCA